VQYDALYCDTSVGEEDLPAFLSLLRHGGRAVVVINEELLLLTRGTADPTDFGRSVLAKVSGDLGELEDPTPWEVQEAISRIKAREHRKGLEQAKVGALGGPGACRQEGGERQGTMSAAAREYCGSKCGGPSAGVPLLAVLPPAQTRLLSSPGAHPKPANAVRCVPPSGRGWQPAEL
jgi:hypothetical protein